LFRGSRYENRTLVIKPFPIDLKVDAKIMFTNGEQIKRRNILLKIKDDEEGETLMEFVREKVEQCNNLSIVKLQFHKI